MALQRVIDVMIDQAKAEEIEACAKIADRYEKEWEGKSYGSMRECAANIAARIRNRGKYVVPTRD